MAESLPNHKYYTFVMSGTIAAHDEAEAWREFRNYFTLDELLSSCDITVEPGEGGQIHPRGLADLRAYDEDCEGCMSGKHKKED